MSNQLVFRNLGSAPTMIQRTIDYLYLFTMAVALKMAVVLLKWVRLRYKQD